MRQSGQIEHNLNSRVSKQILQPLPLQLHRPYSFMSTATGVSAMTGTTLSPKMTYLANTQSVIVTPTPSLTEHPGKRMSAQTQAHSSAPLESHASLFSTENGYSSVPNAKKDIATNGEEVKSAVSQPSNQFVGRLMLSVRGLRKLTTSKSTKVFVVKILLCNLCIVLIILIALFFSLD